MLNNEESGCGGERVEGGGVEQVHSSKVPIMLLLEKMEISHVVCVYTV